MEDLRGRKIGHFRLAERLGVGGMGVVYRAEDRLAKRTVAVKVLRDELAKNPDLRRRFDVEARALARLEHPNIAAVYEFSQIEDRAILVMEFLAGGDLDRRLAGGPLPFDELLTIGIAVANALAHAHRRRMIHRDVKPANVLFAEDGTPKVSDFGLAKLVDEVSPETSIPQLSLSLIDEEVTTPQVGEQDAGNLPTQAVALTRAGNVVGTLAYMAPEQARAKDVDYRVDVFSLGVVLYRMTAGKLPFPGETVPALLDALLHRRPRPIRDLRTDCPPALEAVILQALEKDPERRYQTVADLGLALREVRALLGGQAPGVAVQAADRPASGATWLIGRDRELESLLKRLELACDGKGQAVVVEGEAGVGKSRLIAELGLRAASRGARMVTGCCLFRTGTRPYQPVLDGLREYLARLGVEDSDALGRLWSRGAEVDEPTAHVVGNWLGLPGARREAASSPDELLDSIESFLLALSEDSPLILHLDDLQWADDATLTLLVHLAHRVEDRRILLLGSYRGEDISGRDDESGARLPDYLERLISVPWVHQVTLERLDLPAVSELVRALYPDRVFHHAFLKRLAEDSAGNPLFAIETLHLLEDEGLLQQAGSGEVPPSVMDTIPSPERVQALVERRLRPLAEADRETLEAAAVEGERFHADTIAAALERGKLPLLKALQRLERDHKLIRPEDGRYRFVHKKIREVLYESIPAELRTEYHRVVGRQLAAVHGDEPDMASTIAYQLLEGGDEEQAAPFLVAAGLRAREFWATEDALRFLERSGEILSRGAATDEALHRSQLAELGEVQIVAGQYERAESSFERLRERVERSDRRELCHAMSSLARVRFLRGEYRSAATLAGETLVVAEEAEIPGFAAAARSTLGDVLWSRGKREEALAEYRTALDLQEGIGDERGIVDGLARIAHVQLILGQFEQALSAYERALQLALELRDRRAEAHILNGIGGTLLAEGNAARAVGRLRAALRIREEILDRRGASKTLNNLGYACERLGRFEEARRHLERSLELKRTLQDHDGLANTLINVASVRERLGHYDQALDALREAERVKGGLGAEREIPQCLCAQGVIFRKLHRAPESRRLLTMALSSAEALGATREVAWARTQLAVLDLETGEGKDPAAQLRSAADTARRSGCQEEEFGALCHLLAVSARDRETPVAELDGVLERARELAGELDADEFRARLHAVEASCAERRGAIGAALDHHHAAGRITERRRLRGLSWQVHLELARFYERVDTGPGNRVPPTAADEYRKAAAELAEIARSLEDEESRRAFLSARAVREVESKSGVSLAINPG